MSAFWLPFTPNRAFKKRPRLISRAKDMHYYTPEGRAILDGTAGLGAATRTQPPVDRVRDPGARRRSLIFSDLPVRPSAAFQLASRLAELAPGDLDHVFYCNSGSEACDTALKIALAYHNVRGQASRTRLIGASVAITASASAAFRSAACQQPQALRLATAGVDHLPATYNREHQAFTKGEPEWGPFRRRARGIVALHDASTIAAVIVEPMAGSTGVLPARPRSYLKRLREICDKHGILLIFDEVITGFGRLGAPFAAERYGVQPDMITFAKGVFQPCRWAA